MLRSWTWGPAKLLALAAAAVFIGGTLEVASHTDGSHVLQEASSSSAQNRLFDQIAEDLKPFASGISLQQVERAFCAGGDNHGFRYKAVLSEPHALSVHHSAAPKPEMTSAFVGLPAPCIQFFAMCPQTANLRWAHVCHRRTEGISVEEQAGTSGTITALMAGLLLCE